MITILHGNDSTASRNAFFEAKNASKNNILLSGEELTYDLLFQNIESKTMFSEPVSIFVEGFFSKNKSNSTEFKKISEYLKIKNQTNIFFWEGSEVSKTALSQFKDANIKQFVVPQQLFAFLDNLKPNNSEYSLKLFHELKKTMETELVFFMITRQFRLLLASTDSGSNNIDEIKRLAPWKISKFKNQINFFGKESLISSYKKMFNIDYVQKTGKSPVDLSHAIDFFLTSL